MSGETAIAACCCQGRVWYALKCTSYFDNYCCDPGCDTLVNRIEFCEWYLRSIGVPMPTPDPTKCYYISYNCCVYILTGYDESNCPKPNSPYPTNVGTLFKIGNRSGQGGDPCCFPEPVTHVPVGGIGDLTVQGSPVITEPTAPCEEMVAECYDLPDQAGTVRGKEIRINSTAKTCVDQFGIDWSVRCNHGPPRQIVPMQTTLSQKMSLTCLCCREENGQCVQYGPCIEFCPNERHQRFYQHIDCDSTPNCVPDGDCCGSVSPCEEDPNYCDSYFNPLKTYDVKTCYSLTNCGNDQDEDVLRITFPCCFLENNLIACNAENAEQITEFFVNNVVQVLDQVEVNTGWGPFKVPAVQVCDLKVICFSGNAAHIAERINARLGGFIEAHGIGPWSAFFWFGLRQSCVLCENGTPNTQPPASGGDQIYVDRAVYNPLNNTVDVFLRATSPRFYACATQSMHAEYETRGPSFDIINAAISATGQSVPFAIQCLSFPEYSFGQRYTMKAIEENPANPTTIICTGWNGQTNQPIYENVPSCASRSGFPLDNIYIYPPIGPPILVQYGWHYLCGGMNDPQTRCYSYPFTSALKYEVAPCCPPDTDCDIWNVTHPLPEPCFLAFQSTNTACITSGGDITITT